MGECECVVLGTVTGQRVGVFVVGAQVALCLVIM